MLILKKGSLGLRGESNLVLPELVQQQLVSTTSFCYIHGRSLEYYFMVMVMVIYSALL